VLLEVKSIRKSYSDVGGELHILKGIDLKVDYNQTIAITGESGSGKSTLLHLLGLLDNADSGQIIYLDKKREFSNKDSARFRNENIGFIFQYHYLLDDLTACENVAMPNFIKTGNWRGSLLKAQELVERVDLKDRKNHFPNQLSGGEQQRVAVARALINKPIMILADEPTGNLDQRHSDEIIDLIINLNKKENSSLIIVTHNKEIAGRMQEHYLLKDGLLH